MCGSTDDLLTFRIEDHDVGIGADRNRAFLWEKTKDFCGCCRREFDEPIEADSLLNNTTVENQTHAIFDARPAIWNLGKVAAAKFLLLFKTERAMVGRN